MMSDSDFTGELRQFYVDGELRYRRFRIEYRGRRMNEEGRAVPAFPVVVPETAGNEILLHVLGEEVPRIITARSAKSD